MYFRCALFSVLQDMACRQMICLCVSVLSLNEVVLASKSMEHLFCRNIQMLLSSLQHHTGYYARLFSGPNMMPSISQIQKLIEQAWRNGFDLQVCTGVSFPQTLGDLTCGSKILYKYLRLSELSSGIHQKFHNYCFLIL